MRAYVKSSGGNVDNVRARLRAYRNNIELTGSPRLAGNNPITVKSAGGNRVNTNDSFWFYIPKDWRSSAVKLRVELDYSDAIDETNESNNTLERTVFFWPGSKLNLVMVPLKLYPGGDTDKSPKIFYATNPTFPELLDNILRFHPIPGINWWYIPSAFYLPPFTPNPATDSGKSMILNWVEWANALTDDPAAVTYYQGMVHPDLDTDGGLGKGNRPGRNSWAKMINSNSGWPDWYITGGNSMAHELGHNKGLRHINCSGNESGGGSVDPNYPYPYPNCRLSGPGTSGFYGFDVYYDLWGLSGPTVLSNDPNAASPNQAFPLLGYQRPRWISDYEYCKLLPSYGGIIPCGAVPGAAASVQDELEQAVLADPLAYADPEKLAALQAATRYILAGGLIDLAANTAQFSGVYQTDTPGADTVASAAEKLGYAAAFSLDADPPHLLMQVGADGQVLASQEIFLENDDGDGTSQQFLELVPLADGVTSLQVWHGALVLAEQPVSANPPVVQLLLPNGGGQLNAGDTVRWSASDPEGDALTFSLQYSADNGGTWRLIAMGVTGDSFTLPTPLDLPGSTQGRMRVVANDGFWTGQDESDAPFTVANAAPLVAITAPEPIASAELGSLVVLEGMGTDLEDGPLGDDRLSWASDKDGPLGVGEELALDNLSAGEHRVTLTAADSGGRTTSAAITLFVGVSAPRVYLPVIVR